VIAIVVSDRERRRHVADCRWHFKLETAGPNGHSCILEGEIREGRAQVEYEGYLPIARATRFNAQLCKQRSP
jgi:hypothetical protein